VTTRIAQLTIDVVDVETMAAFWSAALGYRIRPGDDGDAHLEPGEAALPGSPTIWLQPCAEPKADGHKNRDHPDLRPLDGDAESEAERLIRLGAQRVNVGQRDDDPFIVLADPEGNEFCVLRSS
jgi:catechol 2,3-dioxygenase-like lactoylglutathione lyase family enzyme